MQKEWIRALVALLLLALGASLGRAAAPVVPAADLGTAFSYQGSLMDGGSPATGSYDLTFGLVDAATSTTLATLTKENVPVAGGLFTVQLDFGADAFTGASRSLRIGARPGSSTGAFVLLSPLQPLTASPYALGLRPGARVSGTQAGGSALTVENKSTANQSYALYAHGSGLTSSDSYTYGVYGRSSAFRGTGVYGWADHANGQGYGVVGHSVSAQGTGVYGLAEPGGIGVYGKVTNPGGTAGKFENTGGGRAVAALGNAVQTRTGFGLAKAAVYIGRDGTILRSFDDGWGYGDGTQITCTAHGDGWYQVDFNFRVNDRYIVVTPADSSYSAAFQFNPWENDEIYVQTRSLGYESDWRDGPFMVLVF